MSIEGSQQAQSSYRFETLREAEQVPSEPPREPASAEPERVGRYAELNDSHARVAGQLQTEAQFGAGIRDAVTERFGAAREAHAEPMQLDGLSAEALRQPAQGHSGGDLQHTPFGPMLQHSPQQAASQGSEKKLSFFEDHSEQTREREDKSDAKKQEGYKVKTLSFYEDKDRSRDIEH